MVLVLFVCAAFFNKVHGSDVSESFKVAFETNVFVAKCTSKELPMWSWVGKNTNDIRSMAIGEKKQSRFKEPR